MTKYKVGIHPHGEGTHVGKFLNMVTKYHMEKSQPFMNSIKDIIKNPRKRKKRNKKTVNKKKERKKTYFKYMKNGGLNSKYNIKMARKFRRRTRRKRGGGGCEDDYDCDDLDNETHTGKCVEDNDGNRVCTAITNNQGGRRRRKRTRRKRGGACPPCPPCETSSKGRPLGEILAEHRAAKAQRTQGKARSVDEILAAARARRKEAGKRKSRRKNRRKSRRRKKRTRRRRRKKR